MLHTNYLRAKLANRQSVIGTWVTLPSSNVSEIVALAGLDFIIIDREHGSLSFETVTSMIMACENQGVSPLVRVADLTLSEVQRALDIGAHGIHVPNIEHPDQLDALIRFAKYPPRGNRGFSPFTRALGYGSSVLQEQTRIANESTLIAIHIEGRGALDKLDLFLRHSEVDIVFLGLYDLSKSLGIPGEVNHPQIIRFLKESVQKIKESGKIAGTIATSIEQTQKFLSYGLTYISYSVDCHILSQSYASVVQAFRSKNPAYV